MLLITDPVHSILTDGLAAKGIPFEYRPGISMEELMEALPNSIGLVVRNRNITSEMLKTATKLKLIARAGSGLENIDIAAAENLGIKFIHAAGANANTVGEHAVGMLLSLLHKINKSDSEVKQGKWDREGNRGIELGGKTIGIVGYGHTGMAVAKKLKGFDVKILAYDKYKTGFGYDSVTEASMDDIFAASDILSLHIPLTAETKNMVNSEFLNRFAKPIILMNLCRGEVVNLADLIEAMKSDNVRACCLDVLEIETPNEYLQTDWFRYLSNNQRTVLTPHVAGWSEESYRNISEVLLKEILAINLY